MALDLIKCLKQIKRLLLTCASISEIPSNISTMAYRFLVDSPASVTTAEEVCERPSTCLIIFLASDMSQVHRAYSEIRVWGGGSKLGWGNAIFTPSDYAPAGTHLDIMCFILRKALKDGVFF